MVGFASPSTSSAAATAAVVRAGLFMPCEAMLMLTMLGKDAQDSHVIAAGKDVVLLFVAILGTRPACTTRAQLWVLLLVASGFALP